MTDHDGNEISNPGEPRKWADEAVPDDPADKPTDSADPNADASATTELRDELESIRATGEDR